MYLKTLTIKGFKSFAESSSLKFEPGVTVVVGPNGSGKSNVVDAVAWVLGAQGPRTVRSSKMEDVIFAGSTSRPALGRAEVSLTIDNRAGRLPGGLAEITISRTLFRSGDSEYAINGQSCRLLDIQELLSDSGVGRQQHVIVSQGQLDQILNARPEERRSVVEEAAGVLKHRRRRERAERRLAAADENLERLGDLSREVRRQIKPLERQASAARSHATIADELRALRLYLLGRELATLSQRRTHSQGRLASLSEEEAKIKAGLVDLDTAADVAAASLAGRDEEGLVDSLTRVEGLVERARGLSSVLTERARSLARALDASADTDVVSTLEAQGSRLQAEIETARSEEVALRPDLVAIEIEEQSFAAEQAEFESAVADAGGQRAAQQKLAETRANIEPLRRALSRDSAQLARLLEQAEAAAERKAAAQAELAELMGMLEEAEQSVPRLREQAGEAERLISQRRAALTQAEGALQAAEKARHRAEAKVEAMARAIADARGQAGVETLAGIEGMAGTLSDAVRTDEGWRAPFEAAVGAALAAVVVSGSSSVRDALARLVDSQSAATVLAVLVGAVGEGNELLEAGLSSQTSLPGGAESVRGHVRSAVAGLDRVLDRLLEGAVAVDSWEEAYPIALANPHLTVVTRAGDRFAPSGWRLRVGGAGANQADLDAAEEQAHQVARSADEAAVIRDRARADYEQAAAEASEAKRIADRAADRLQSMLANRDRLEGQQQRSADDADAASAGHQEVVLRIGRDEAALADLQAILPELEEQGRQADTDLAAVRQARRDMEERRAELARRAHSLQITIAGVAERRRVLTDRMQDVERRLAGHVAEREHAAERRRRLEADALAVTRLAKMVGSRREELAELAESLRAERSRQLEEARQGGARLEELRRQRSSADRSLEVARQSVQQIEVQLAEIDLRLESASEIARRDLGVEPDEIVLVESPALPEGMSARARSEQLEKELISLGPVNPLALEELTTLTDRSRFLDEQIEDVKRARRELLQVIRVVNDEIVRLFAEAFADVNEHFQVLVATLFPGGTGRLVLTEPEDLLSTGVEVEARPAGKNVRKLSLLSGGERSLVAMAFLFAVFRSRPSPFYLLDEVEAALDDVNLHRFLELLKEFRGDAQMIIVSHQKRTMEAADALYGVTQKGGSSKVISQKVASGDKGVVGDTQGVHESESQSPEPPSLTPQIPEIRSPEPQDADLEVAEASTTRSDIDAPEV